MTDWPDPPFATKDKGSPAAAWLTRLLRAARGHAIKTVTVAGGWGKIVERPEGAELVIVPPKVSAAGASPFPFQIIKAASPATGSTATTFDVNGVPVTCNIDNTVPTDFTANPPTVNPDTDGWRFWKVRGGAFEFRPFWNLNLPNDLGSLAMNYNNSPCWQIVDSTVLVLQKAINPGGFGATGWSVFLEIIPDQADGTPFEARFGIKWTGTISLGVDLFVQGNPLIIPIGLLYGESDNLPSTTNMVQLQRDHILRRYATGMLTVPEDLSGYDRLTSVFAGPGLFRGDWQNDNIQDMLFYPGDTVWFNDDVTGTVIDDQTDFVTGNFSSLYMKVGAIGYDTDPSSSPGWKKVSTGLTSTNF